MKRHLGTALAILFVIAAYFFFGSYGKFEFVVHWDGRPGDAMYAGLAEGFRNGQLAMIDKPDERLIALPHPYDHAARHDAGIPYLWDASYFNGRYYLYFSPLPALLFYLPYRWIAGTYPLDQLAAVFFAAWTFLAAALFLITALKNVKRHVPLPVWILLAGLGNVIPFVMVFSRTYEVAALCGSAMTATWAWSLARYLESPRTSRLVWMSFWLAMSIAARPNLGLLLPLAVIAMLTSIPRREWLRGFIAAGIPMAIIGAAVMYYNYARFHDVFEFGQTYQLTYMPMAEYKVCSCRNVAELFRIVNSSSLYLFAPPYLSSQFPFAGLSMQVLDPAVSFTTFSEEVGGIAPLAPLALLGSLVAALLALRRGSEPSSARAGLFVVAAAWIALAGLSSCWFVTARYSLDFWVLMVAGAVICIERGLAVLGDAGLRITGLRAATIALALYSIVLGLLLGLRGNGGQFYYGNPELFDRLVKMFG